MRRCVFVCEDVSVCVQSHSNLCVFVGVCVCVCAYSKARLEVGLFLLRSLMCPCVCNWNTWVIDSLSPPSQITAPGVFECTHLEALGQSRQLWQTKACQAWTTHKHTHTETHTYIESPTEAKQIWTCRHTKAKLEAQTRTYARTGTYKKLTGRCWYVSIPTHTSCWGGHTCVQSLSSFLWQQQSSVAEQPRLSLLLPKWLADWLTHAHGYTHTHSPPFPCSFTDSWLPAPSLLTRSAQDHSRLPGCPLPLHSSYCHHIVLSPCPSGGFKSRLHPRCFLYISIFSFSLA